MVRKIGKLASRTVAAVARAGDNVAFPPLTVSREALLDGSSDQAFRDLVNQMLAFGAVLHKARETLARAAALTPPQYGILMTVARQGGSKAMSVGEVAEALGVSLPFVVKQTGLMVEQGYLLKQTDAGDRRRVNLVLTRRSLDAIRALAPLQVRINDVLFGSLSRDDATALGGIVGGLLASARTLAL